MKITGVATLFFSMRIFFFFLRKESPNLVLRSPTAKEKTNVRRSEIWEQD